MMGEASRTTRTATPRTSDDGGGDSGPDLGRRGIHCPGPLMTGEASRTTRTATPRASDDGGGLADGTLSSRLGPEVRGRLGPEGGGGKQGFGGATRRIPLKVPEFRLSLVLARTARTVRDEGGRFGAKGFPFRLLLRPFLERQSPEKSGDLRGIREVAFAYLRLTHSFTKKCIPRLSRRFYHFISKHTCSNSRRAPWHASRPRPARTIDAINLTDQVPRVLTEGTTPATARPGLTK